MKRKIEEVSQKENVNNEPSIPSKKNGPATTKQKQEQEQEQPLLVVTDRDVADSSSSSSSSSSPSATAPKAGGTIEGAADRVEEESHQFPPHEYDFTDRDRINIEGIFEVRDDPTATSRTMFGIDEGAIVTQEMIEKYYRMMSDVQRVNHPKSAEAFQILTAAYIEVFENDVPVIEVVRRRSPRSEGDSSRSKGEEDENADLPPAPLGLGPDERN